MKKVLLLICLALSFCTHAQIITSFAGNGSDEYFGDNTPALTAGIPDPGYTVVDKDGDLLLCESDYNRIREIDTSGIVTTIAGTGVSGFSGDGGQATDAELWIPTGLALDNIGNIFFSDAGNNRIRKIDAITHIITTIAGSDTGEYSGDGGPATAAALWDPQGICFDKFNNLYLVDQFNFRVRKIDTAGIITTFAGTGVEGYPEDGVAATSQPVDFPNSLISDDTGNIYMSDAGSFSCRIRKIDTSGIITTIAGNGSSAYTGDGVAATSAAIVPYGLAIDSAHNLFVADRYNQRVYKIDTGHILHCIAGNGVTGWSGDGGPATASELYYSACVAVDACGNVYVSDVGSIYTPDSGSNIRKVNFSIPDTAVVSIAGSSGSVCAGSSVTYAATVSNGYAYKYSWLVNGAAMPGDTLNSYTYIPMAGDSIRCVAIAQGRCFGGMDTVSSNTLHPVVAGALPAVHIAASTADTVCAGTVVAYSAAVAGSSAATCSWYVNGLATGTGTVYTCTPVSGDHIWCIVTGDNLCNGNADTLTSNTITMTDTGVLPSLHITASRPDTVCPGTMVTYFATAAGSSISAWMWYVNGVPYSSGSMLYYTPASGDYISCRITGTDLCNGNTDTLTSNTITMTDTGLTPAVHISVSPSDTICGKLTVTLTATTANGGTAPAYRWLLNGTTAGTDTSYSYLPENGDSLRCVLTSAGGDCTMPGTYSSNTIYMAVDEPVSPVLTISGPSGATVGSSSMVTFTATVTPAIASYSIAWYDDGVLVATTTTPDLTYTKTDSTDTIKAVLIPHEFCYDTAVSHTSIVTSHNEAIGTLQPRQLNIYPNPVYKNLSLTLSDGAGMLVVSDIMGKALITTPINGTHMNIDMGGLPAGVYMLTVTDAGGNKSVHKVVKE